MIKSAPGWNPDSATESEADVKADRDPSPTSIEELQKESVEIIEEDGGKIKRTAERITQKIERFEDKLEKGIEEKGEKAIEKLAHHAESAGTTLGTATGTIKGKADRAEEKVSSFVKESLDSIKKTVDHGAPDQKKR